MRIQFKDIGKIVDVPDDATEEYIDDVYDDLSTSMSTGETPKIEKFPNVLTRAARAALGPQLQAVGGAMNTAAFGLPGAAVERFAPQEFKEFMEPQGLGESIGRGVGNIAGFVGGGPQQLAGRGALKLVPKSGKFLKGAIGTGAATASLSPSELASGSSPEMEAAKVGGLSLLGGASEFIPKTIFKGAFRKNIKREKLEGLLSDIGKVKESIKKNPKATVKSKLLLKKIDDIYNGLADPVRRNATDLKRWRDYLSKNPEVHGDKILQMERELGSVAKFGGTKGGFMQFMKPKSPVANEATKAGRAEASSVYDVLATKQGFPEFATKSKKAASILKRYPDLDPSKGDKDWGERVGAAILASTASGNPFLGFGAYLAEKAMQTGSTKQAAYKLLKSRGVDIFGKGVQKATVGGLATLDK